MNAGLPGTGIGGLFYIASALWMPVHRALYGRTHASRAWSRVFGQLGIAGGILFALFATGWVLGLFVTADVFTDIASGVGGGAAVQRARNVVQWVAVLGTAGLLLMVLLTVEAAGLVMRRRVRRHAAIPSSSPPTDLPRVRARLRKVA